jgi:hypothetical protein
MNVVIGTDFSPKKDAKGSVKTTLCFFTSYQKKPNAFFNKVVKKP